MSTSRVLIALGLLVFIFLLIYAFNTGSQVARHDSAETEDAGANQKPALTQAAASQAQAQAPTNLSQASQMAQTSKQASRQTPPSSQQQSLYDVLEKYSGTKEWHFDRDGQGRIFKITGAVLKGVMNNDATHNRFLSEFEKAIGFETSPIFKREDESTSSLSIVEQKQFFELPDGGVLPVFEAKLRLIGNKNGDATIIYNELRPIDPEAPVGTLLSSEDALAIATQYLRSQDSAGEGFEFNASNGNFIFAHGQPQQQVSEIIVRIGPMTRRLLIGHHTKTIVWDRPLTLR